MSVLDNLQEITLDKPANKIIRQIRSLVATGQLQPGDRLPSERKLSEKFGVGRSHIREALMKLEFFGILKTLPQSGTVVAGVKVAMLEGLINDILALNENEYHAFVETRVILETNAARLAAERACPKDLTKIEKALSRFRARAAKGEQGIEEDLSFHMKIAEASKNTVLHLFMINILPDLVKYTRTLNTCGDGRYLQALKEHEEIFAHIKQGNPKEAEMAMKTHLNDVLDYSRAKNSAP